VTPNNTLPLEQGLAMSKYFDRLKQFQTEKNSLYSHRPEVPNPTKAPFGSFVSSRRANDEKILLMRSCES